MKSVALIKSRCVGATVVAMVMLVATCDAVRSENWPQWRGPKNNGISNETNTPTKWSKTENVAWRLPMPGPAGATPVVWGEQIFLTSMKTSLKHSQVT